MADCNISTLVYCFDSRGRVLLIHRARPPNRGLWSPIGGKVHLDAGESPHGCACRETREEIGIEAGSAQFHLAGIITEQSLEGPPHWMMFLFELKRPLLELPPPHPEGSFAFHTRDELADLPIPETDRRMIWPLFWAHRGGFFAARCLTGSGDEIQWQIEESWMPGG